MVQLHTRIINYLLPIMMPMHCQLNNLIHIQITHTLKWCQSIFSSMAQFMADYSPTKWCLSSMTQFYSRIIITHILKWCQGIVSSLIQFHSKIFRLLTLLINAKILSVQWSYFVACWLDYSPTKIMPKHCQLMAEFHTLPQITHLLKYYSKRVSWSTSQKRIIHTF